MKFRHPSKERLHAWLSGSQIEDEASLEAHIDDCDRCTTVLEALAEPAASESLVLALAHVLSAPRELPERLEARVAQRLSGRELVGLMAELFGAGVETGRLLIVEPPPPETS